MKKLLFCLAIPAHVCSVLAQPAGGGAYPSQPITVISPAPAGSGAETELRQFLVRVTAATGPQFVVIQKPGAGGTIAANFVARAKPDGYTLLLVQGDFPAAPALYDTLPFNPVKDFAPVTILVRRPAVLLVNSSLPFKTAGEYFAYAKANPGKLNFAAVSAGTRLNAIALNRAAGIETAVIDYKGTSEAMRDLLTGRVDVTVLTPLVTTAHVKSGKLTVLGIATAGRSPLMPGIPTLAEQGAPGYTYASWVGLLAPADTPPAILDKLQGWFAAAGLDPALREKAKSEIVEVLTSTPKQATDYINAEMQHWRSVAGK